MPVPEPGVVLPRTSFIRRRPEAAAAFTIAAHPRIATTVITSRLSLCSATYRRPAAGRRILPHAGNLAARNQQAVGVAAVTTGDAMQYWTFNDQHGWIVCNRDKSTTKCPRCHG